jgi:toxin ParE1/3/4
MTGLLHDEAREELDRAVAWYERQRQGLGLEFLDEVRRKVLRIISTPDRFPKVTDDARRCTTTRFPYSIIYTQRGGNCIVLAVMRQSRDPNYWQHRLD